MQYVQEIFPVLATIADNFLDFTPIIERICRCWRYMVLSYRTAMAPLLPALAEKLGSGFAKSRQGCFLWATDSIVREFSEGAEYVDTATTAAIFAFFEQQATAFLRALNELTPEDLPDVIEDFFRLSIDVLLYYSDALLASSLITSILAAAIASLTLLAQEPLIATLHFLRDLLAYAGEDSPSSGAPWNEEEPERRPNPPQIRNAVVALIEQQGESITQRVLTGMMYSFPRDCVPDASGVLLALFEALPQQVARWVERTVDLLPVGSVTPQERQALTNSMRQ